MDKVSKSNTCLLNLTRKLRGTSQDRPARCLTGSSIKSQVLDLKTLPIFRLLKISVKALIDSQKF